MPIDIIQPGDPSPNPFTICLIASPAVEAPTGSGSYRADPVLSDVAAFTACTQYVVNNLFGRLPNQKELLLGDPNIATHVRVISFRDPALTPSSANALIGLDRFSDILMPNADAITAFIAARQIAADVVFAVSKSQSHTRASASHTRDDVSRGGVPFTVDGVPLTHCHFALAPGAVAIHVSAGQMTAIHEFGHAISSYQNGRILDLYADSEAAINNKRRRPIPATFGDYCGVALSSDQARDHIGYKPGWQSYHCALVDAANPAIMDDYFSAAVPTACQHDQITRRFIIDRIMAKIGRP